ncbi:MAG: hypothetical protein ABSC95_00200 [Acetobacteraceae bacterium]|jgi:hypothetical protein
MLPLANGSDAAGQEAAIIHAIERRLEPDGRPGVLEVDNAEDCPHEIVEQMKEPGLFGARI